MTSGGTRRLAVRLAADPASVPGARRFVVDGLNAHGRGHLADAAELVVSELAGNAALHGEAEFLFVSVAAREDGVRVAVEDDGPVTADAVSPSAGSMGEPDDVDEWESEATTGRGLAIVSMLATDWGVDLTPRGKRVWADVTDPDTVNEVRPPTRASSDAEVSLPTQLPPGWVLVRMAGCPVELSIRQDQHLDDLVRELQLLAADRDNPHSRAIADEIADLLTAPAHARLTGRRLAEQARAAGQEYVDIDLAMPPDFAPMVRRLQDAVSRADQLCEDNQLLAIGSPPQIRDLRDWMTHEIISQLEHGEPPLPWSEWVALRKPSEWMTSP